MTTVATESSASTETTAAPTFDALPLSDEVRRAIDEMGYVNPTQVQVAAYEPAVDGADLIVQARTGTGKTAAFGIPLIDRIVRPVPGFQALILAPTRELALQSSRELSRIAKHRDIRTSAVYGGAPMERQVRELKEGAQIVSGTPGRVLDHLRRGTLDPSGLRALVLDEADEMLSMGFAKELNAIIELLPKERQTLLFSATVDTPIQRVAQKHMKEPHFIGLSSDQVGAKTISHYVYMISGTGRAQDLIRILEVEDPENAIVFCNMRSETERVASALQQAGFDADWLNGDLPQSEREKVMKATREGRLRFLVATDVAARGIDISHVTHVINYTFPESVEQYIHRTGRTGRAGRTGTAISLVSPQELGSLYYLRLQYKIFPVERSLPTAGEERTRKEADRVTMLEQAFPAMPTEAERSLARRLLTHPEAERLVGGLVNAFFGGQGSAEEVDEQAAAARRTRAATPVAEAPEGNGREGRSKRSSGEEGRKRNRRSSRPNENDNGNGDSQGARGEDDGATPEDMTRLWVNVGRRDGMRAGEIAKLIRENCELSRSDLGRIRVRDKHSFVDVATPQVDAVVASLDGKTVDDRELAVEVARSEK